MRRLDRTRSCLFLAYVGVLAGCVGTSPPEMTGLTPVPAPGPTPVPVSGPTPVPPPAPVPPGGVSTSNPAPVPGATSFTTVELAPPPASSAGSDATPPGRLTNVEEADIYRLAGSHLFYFSTYRGFLVYDLSDPKRPQALARLPIHGYPVEMFVDGNTVYAFVREALYLTHTDGTLQFEQRFVSQLHAIDVSDPAAPRLLATLDITGKLFEGVTRRVGNTIYAVAAEDGWQYGSRGPTGIWVYSFDISDAGHPRQVSALSVVEPNRDPKDPRRFADTAVSATSTALMVAENYLDTNRQEPDGSLTPLPSRAVISIFDISDPGGTIVRRTRLETFGYVEGSPRMSFRSDSGSSGGKATFFGILSREDPAERSTLTRRLELESWDVTDGAAPARLASLTIGRYADSDTWHTPSAFDLERNLLYAVGFASGDPLVAIDVADPSALKVRSSLGENAHALDTFRPIAGGQFLLGVGDQPAGACTGEAPSDQRPATQITLTLLDARDPDRLRLVQRHCAKIPGDAGGNGLYNRWNLSVAHKLLGSFADGDLNILTVPIWFARRQEITESGPGFYYQHQTAISLLTWDLSRLNETGTAGQQNVLQGQGVLVHPEGEVKRSVVFRHPVTGARTLVGISDTHLSLANVDDLEKPGLESSLEVAPAVYEIHKFGDFLVERVDIGGRWAPDGAAEFRVKPLGGAVGDKPPVATFQVGQTREVFRHKDQLVVLRTTATVERPRAPTEAVIYDLSDPTRPRLASRLLLPFQSTFYYGFSCGISEFGYWVGQDNDALMTDIGLVRRYFPRNPDGTSMGTKWRLAVLDLRDPDAPAVFEAEVPANLGTLRGLVADPESAATFYLTHRAPVDPVSTSYGPFRYFAQRWEIQGRTLVSGEDINLPGPLAGTWVQGGGQRMFLATDVGFRGLGSPVRADHHRDARLHLLRQVGANAAELLATQTLPDTDLRSLLFDGRRLFVNVSQGDWIRIFDMPDLPWQETSDRLLTFDLSSGSLAPLYDQPIRAYDTQLMGLHENNLFIQLGRDGVLVTDVSVPAHPSGAKFLRTLEWATHVEFAKSEAYVAGGSFGVLSFDLADAFKHAGK